MSAGGNGPDDLTPSSDVLRSLVQIGLDGSIWLAALLFAAFTRYDLDGVRLHVAGLIPLIPVVYVVQGLVGWTFGLYNGSWREGSFEEVPALAKASAVAAVAMFVFDWSFNLRAALPLSASIGAGPVALVGLCAIRYVRRESVQRRDRPRGGDVERVLVFGAGEAADQILRSMLRDPSSRFLPVALLDDDPRKGRLRLSGVEVCGGRGHLADAARRYAAHSLLIAVPSAKSSLVMELTGLAAEVGLKTRVLPSVGELLSGEISLSDIRNVTDADLLGRHETKTDLSSIAGYLAGRRVLVTGAGGSIGSELCRQISRLAPAELIMIDRDESALHAVQLSIEGRSRLESENLILLDIRDVARVNEVFSERRPHVVFHAAALKHLPILERFPRDAVRSNVLGTLAVLEAAAGAGADRFVNISTDKAANPTSVLGYTKRISERLTAHFSATSPGTYLSVRFGNVLGSRGSVLGVFHTQIEAGGPITVTHPDVTRFFMTVQEAVQLIIQAGAIGRNGEALVLDMGSPVRIADVARRLAATAARPIAIEFTGLRMGEKLHEELLGSGEVGSRPIHPLITHVSVEPLVPESALGLVLSADCGDLVRALAALCGKPAEHVESSSADASR